MYVYFSIVSICLTFCVNSLAWVFHFHFTFFIIIISLFVFVSWKKGFFSIISIWHIYHLYIYCILLVYSMWLRYELSNNLDGYWRIKQISKIQFWIGCIPPLFYHNHCCYSNTFTTGEWMPFTITGYMTPYPWSLKHDKLFVSIYIYIYICI